MIAFLGENPHLLRTILVVRVVITITLYILIKRRGKMIKKKSVKANFDIKKFKSAVDTANTIMKDVHDEVELFKQLDMDVDYLIQFAKRLKSTFTSMVSPKDRQEFMREVNRNE